MTLFTNKKSDNRTKWYLISFGFIHQTEFENEETGKNNRATEETEKNYKVDSKSCGKL